MPRTMDPRFTGAQVQQGLVTIPEADFGGGMDQKSAETRIAAGKSEDLLNVETNSQGTLKKRNGYQGYAGGIPLRVSSLTQDNVSHTISLKFPDGVDLTNVSSGPILVTGFESGLTNSPFANPESVKYYAGFSNKLTQILTAPSGSLNLGAAHGLTSPYMFTQTVELTNQPYLDYSMVEVDSTDIAKVAPYDVTLNYNVPIDTPTITYYAGKSPLLGSVYVRSDVFNTVNATYSVLAATHQLSTFNISTRVFIDNGTTLEEMLPDNVLLNSSTGTVIITLTGINGNISPVTVVTILTTTPLTNNIGGTANSNSDVTIEILNPTSPYVFATCYLQRPDISVDTYEQVMPDDISYNSSTNTVSVTFDNGGPVASFRVFYEYGELKINELVLADASMLTSGTTDSVALNVYGIAQASAYGSNRVAPAGVTNFIDSYLNDQNNCVVAGLGGVFYAALAQNKLPINFAPTLYPRSRVRVASAATLAPALWDTTESSIAFNSNQIIRTRDYITADNAQAHWCELTAITWQSGNLITATVNAPNWAVYQGDNHTPGSLSNAIVPLIDYISLQSCGYTTNEGVFLVHAISAIDSNTLEITYFNPTISGSDYDESDVGGLIGSFTDVMQADVSELMQGDIILSEAFDESDGLIVADYASPDYTISNVLKSIVIPVGLTVYATRTSSIIPLRDLAGSLMTGNIVPGDQAYYTPYVRYLTIRYVNPNASLTALLSSVDGEATLTLSSPANFTPGQTLNVVSQVGGSGQFQITSIFGLVLTGTCTFDSIANATIIGSTVEIDETLAFTDSRTNAFTFSIPYRMWSIEQPVSTQDLAPVVTQNYLPANDYVNQPTVRSNMVNNNLFMTDGVDPVLKTDTASIYRAGLPRWQPACFMSIDSSAGNKITTHAITANVTGWAGSIFNAANAAAAATFNVGDLVKKPSDDNVYKVIGIDTTHNLIAVDQAIAGGTAAAVLSTVTTYSYYFRLNAVDSQNNVTASAVTGLGDYNVYLTQDAAIDISLIGFPNLGLFDYDRLEVQVYRTKADGVAPFYLAGTFPVNCNNGYGYLVFSDGQDDEQLADLDPINSALKQNEVGTTWEGPVRARYTTSINNRLILANVTEWQTFDVRFAPNPLVPLDYSAMIGTEFNFQRGDGSSIVYEFVSDSGKKAFTAAHTVTGLQITSTAHGLVAGDWVYLYRATSADGNRLNYSGHYRVLSVVGVNNFIINSMSPTSPGNVANYYVTATNPVNVPVLLSGNDGNFCQTTEIDSTTTFALLNSMRRLSIAINGSMRNGSTDAWLVGEAGSEFNNDQIIVRKPRSEASVMNLTVTLGTPGNFYVYINQILQLTATASETHYGSRLMMSYQNFPEIFDSSDVALDKLSDSAVDVNSADGQEITAVIPFFGSSAFGAALTDSPLLILKTNSAYLLDIATKTVKKLDTHGLGCTFPYSVAATLKGILFANEGGLYRINRDLSMNYVGFNIERLWREKVDKTALLTSFGHHYAVGTMYKISYIDIDGNPGTLTYDHSREDDALLVVGSSSLHSLDGAWSRHDSIPSSGWCNLGGDEFYARTDGTVWIRRRSGTVSDYRDGDQPINMVATLRGMDFGDASRRKSVRKILVHYRSVSQALSTKIYESVDMSNNWLPMDPVRIKHNDSTDDLSTIEDSRILNIISSPAAMRCLYIQLRFVNDAIDESVEIAGVEYRVKALATSGVTQAANS